IGGLISQDIVSPRGGSDRNGAKSAARKQAHSRHNESAANQSTSCPGPYRVRPVRVQRGFQLASPCYKRYLISGPSLTPSMKKSGVLAKHFTPVLILKNYVNTSGETRTT